MSHNDMIFLAIFLSAVVALAAILRMGRSEPLAPRPTKRTLAILQPACAQCVHWDLAEGAQAMARFPVFQQAAACITVAEMAYGYEYDPETDQRVKLNGPPEATTLGWDDFGACRSHAELRHKTDKCERFEVRS